MVCPEHLTTPRARVQLEVHIPYVQIFANYKPHYAQSLANLGPLQAVSWDQELVLWKLRDNAPLGSSPTSHEVGRYYSFAGVTWKLGPWPVLLADHWDCLYSGWELRTKSSSYRTGKDVLSCTIPHFFFLGFLCSSRHFLK